MRKTTRQRVEDGGIDAFYFISELLPRAMAVTRVPRRLLRRHPYLLDFGLAMAFAGDGRFLLGWDAEVDLEEPANWITPAVALLDRRSDVFSAGPRWPVRDHDTLSDEEWAEDGPWSLNYGFTDQVFLVRRSDLQLPVYRAFAPGAYLRHPEHPWTFETRLEAQQRASRRMRATHRGVRFTHADTEPVLTRESLESLQDRLEHRVLAGLARRLHRVPVRSPRWQFQSPR